MEDTPMNSFPAPSLWESMFDRVPPVLPSLDITMTDAPEPPRRSRSPQLPAGISRLKGSITTNPTKPDSKTVKNIDDHLSPPRRYSAFSDDSSLLDQYTDESYSSDDDDDDDDDSCSAGESHSCGSTCKDEPHEYHRPDEAIMQITLETLSVEFTYNNNVPSSASNTILLLESNHGQFLWASVKIGKGQECVYIVDPKGRTIQFLAARRSIELLSSGDCTSSSSISSRGLVVAMCSRELPGKYEWNLGAVVDSGEHTGVWVCVWPVLENQLPENMREKIVDIHVDEGDYGTPLI